MQSDETNEGFLGKRPSAAEIAGFAHVWGREAAQIVMRIIKFNSRRLKFCLPIWFTTFVDFLIENPWILCFSSAGPYDAKYFNKFSYIFFQIYTVLYVPGIIYLPMYMYSIFHIVLLHNI